MTDARLPSRWLSDPELVGLSERAWRLHTSALMWCNEHRTDGRVPAKTILILNLRFDTAEAAAELVEAKLWKTNARGWQIADWEASQSTAEQLEKARARSRRSSNAARQRDRSKASETAPEGAESHGAVTGHALGKARQGQAEAEAEAEARQGEAVDPQTGEVLEDWHRELVPLGDGRVSYRPRDVA